MNEKSWFQQPKKSASAYALGMLYEGAERHQSGFRVINNPYRFLQNKGLVERAAGNRVQGLKSIGALLSVHGLSGGEYWVFETPQERERFDRENKNIRIEPPQPAPTTTQRVRAAIKQTPMDPDALAKLVAGEMEALTKERFIKQQQLLENMLEGFTETVKDAVRQNKEPTNFMEDCTALLRGIARFFEAGTQFLIAITPKAKT